MDGYDRGSGSGLRPAWAGAPFGLVPNRLFTVRMRALLSTALAVTRLTYWNVRPTTVVVVSTGFTTNESVSITFDGRCAWAEVPVTVTAPTATAATSQFRIG